MYYSVVQWLEGGVQKGRLSSELQTAPPHDSGMATTIYMVLGLIPGNGNPIQVGTGACPKDLSPLARLHPVQ